MYFYNGLHGLYGFLVARGDDGRMQNNPNGRSRRGSKIRIIRAIRCGKTLPKLKSNNYYWNQFLKIIGNYCPRTMRLAASCKLFLFT